MNKKILYLVVGFVILCLSLVLIFLMVKHPAGISPLPPVFLNTSPSPSSNPNSNLNNSGGNNPAPGKVAVDEEANNLRTHYPGSYLKNNLPYQTNDFKANVNFFDDSISQYRFVVTLNDDQAKDSFITWLRSLKLTDQQISKLAITYLNSQQASQVNKIKSMLKPYDGNNFTLSYDPSLDSINVLIYKSNIPAGEQEFNDYLKQNGIDSRDWLNNLTIEYK